MAPVLCREVREVLGAIASGKPVTVPAPVWSALTEKDAVRGTPTSPEITPIGRHVLDELTVRAYRTDTLPLDDMAEHLTRVLIDMDQVAKTAEYFLAELGPVAPPEAVPLLRPVALDLANRRGTPEDLAEEFRNVWGGVEVMGGDSRDRLLAAALLDASSASMEMIYAPLMTTTLKIRERSGEKSRAVVSATLLHLHTGADGKPGLETYGSLLRAGMSEDEAALLTGLALPVSEIQSRRERMLDALEATGLDRKECGFAASYLVVLGLDPARVAPRLKALSEGLKGRHPDPVTAAAVLSTVDWLEPSELVNWMEKAMDIARARRLAPTGPELTAIALALVHGLPRSMFSLPPEVVNPHRVSAGTLALHSWLYRPLLGEPGPVPPTPPGPATLPKPSSR